MGVVRGAESRVDNRELRVVSPKRHRTGVEKPSAEASGRLTCGVQCGSVEFSLLLLLSRSPSEAVSVPLPVGYLTFRRLL